MTTPTVVVEPTASYIMKLAIVDRLTSVIISEVAANDPTVNAVVKVGKLQDDPQKGKANLMVLNADESWPNELYTNQSGVHAPTYLIGSPTPAMTWARRFTVQLTLFFLGLNQAEAQIRADLTMKRAEFALWTIQMPEKDNFGEKAFQVQVCSSWLTHKGGPGNYIFDGAIRLEFLTLTVFPKED